MSGVAPSPESAAVRAVVASPQDPPTQPTPLSIQGEEAVEEGGGGGSQPGSLAYSGDNEEEYLRATWQRLGVGHDGYLSLDELATVCHAIGMEKVANEVLEQLFSRLDVDGDGRISFEEFVHMFQNGGPSGNNSLVLDDSLSHDGPGTPINRVSSVGDDHRTISATESNVFSSIDPSSSGYVTVDSVLELWDSFNISNGEELLGEMGFPQRGRQRLPLRDLTAALEEECRVSPSQPCPPRLHASTTPSSSSSPSNAVTTLQMAALTCLHEAKFLRLSLEGARGERDKLRCDLTEANQRLTLLAQELDDHNAHMEASSQHQLQELERQYREQVRELQEEVVREREAGREQLAALTKELQGHNTQLHHEEARLKAKLSSLYADMKRLEAENLELSEKLQEAEKQLALMERQVADIHKLKNKVAEYESMSPREEEYRRLLDRLEQVTAENQQLRDNNDELLSQMDTFPLRQHNVRSSDKESSLDGSCLGDYVEPALGLLAPVKRRGSNSGSGDDSYEEESPRGSKVRRCSKGLNVHYVDVGSYDESFLDASMSSYLKGSPAPSTQPLTSQPPSLEDSANRTSHPASEDGVLQQDKKEQQQQQQDQTHSHLLNGDSSGINTCISIKMATKEELEIELFQEREEREKMAKLLAVQKEEFCHQLEKKEFECEEALNKYLSVKRQLEKAHHLTQSPPEGGGPDTFPRQSTPIKASHSAPASLREKCVRCGDTEGQLTVALEELEMSLRREEQERTQRISAETLLTTRLELDSEAGSGAEESTTTTTTTTTYPGSTSDHSTTTRSTLHSLPKSPMGEGLPQGRARAIEQQCRGLEGELARVKTEVLKLIREKSQTDESDKLKITREVEGLKKRCRDLTEKIQRKRRVFSPEHDGGDATEQPEDGGGETEGGGGAASEACPSSTTGEASGDDPTLPHNHQDDFHTLEEEVVMACV